MANLKNDKNETFHTPLANIKNALQKQTQLHMWLKDLLSKAMSTVSIFKSVAEKMFLNNQYVGTVLSTLKRANLIEACTRGIIISNLQTPLS